MAKSPKDGGKAPTPERPDPKPPLDTSNLAAAAGPPAGAMDPMMAEAMMSQGIAPQGAGIDPSMMAADPMSQMLMGAGPMGMPGGDPSMMGMPPGGMPPEGGQDPAAEIGAQFGPVVAAAMATSPEVQEVLTQMIQAILSGQGGQPPGGAPPPPGGGMM